MPERPLEPLKKIKDVERTLILPEDIGITGLMNYLVRNLGSDLPSLNVSIGEIEAFLLATIEQSLRPDDRTLLKMRFGIDTAPLTSRAIAAKRFMAPVTVGKTITRAVAAIMPSFRQYIKQHTVPNKKKRK